MKRIIVIASTVALFAAPSSAFATGHGNDKPKQDHTCQGGHNCNTYPQPTPTPVVTPAPTPAPPVVIVVPGPTTSAPDVKQDQTQNQTQTQGPTTVNVDNSITIVNPPAPVVPAAPQTAPAPLKLKGNTLRTVHVGQRKGAKIVKITAYLLTSSGKQNLLVRGTNVIVDLRAKSTGNYNVYITTTYRRTNGSTYKVRTTRNFSVTVVA